MLSHGQTDFFESYTRDYKIPRVIVVKQQIESRGGGLLDACPRPIWAHPTDAANQKIAEAAHKVVLAIYQH